MNAAHLHLIVNHIPVIVTVLSSVVLAWALISNTEAYRKLAFIGFVIAAIFAFVTFESGENAEEIVEDLSGFSHDAIEEHEHAAETAKWFSLILGAAGVAGLYFYKDPRKKGYKSFIYLTLAISLVAAGYLIYTGYLGGLIRHTELASLIRDSIGYYPFRPA